ncbi:hypothetical protein PAXRUDRAFT_179198, partial [Paxillus rubicundulus Ve08.2h10]
LAFSMTINKSQGQSVKYVGLDLIISCVAQVNFAPPEPTPDQIHFPPIPKSAFPPYHLSAFLPYHLSDFLIFCLSLFYP